MSLGTLFELNYDLHPFYDFATGNTFMINEPYYRPGDYVTGTVVLQLSKPLQARGVRIQCQGLEYVHINKGTDDDSNDYYGRNYFINERQTLMGRLPEDTSKAVDVFLIENYRYVLPFRFHIPFNALPTHKFSSWKHISYTLSTNVEIPWKFDHKADSNFIILPPLAVDLIPLGISIVQKEVKRNYLGLINAGKVKYRIHIQNDAVRLGDMISVHINLENNDFKSKIQKLSAKLVAKGIFTAEAHPRHEVEKVSEYAGSIEHAFGNKGGEYVLNVPVLEPKTLTPFNIVGKYINISYLLQVTIHLELLVRNVTETFAIQVLPTGSSLNLQSHQTGTHNLTRPPSYSK